MSAFDPVSSPPRSSAQLSVWLAARVLLVRLRFFLVLAGVLMLVGFWPALRGYWHRLTRPAGGPNGALSLNMEYWCPMCPGVVSDAPAKCSVCNMVLIRREKGEPAPLPDGVVFRMQFSPYRVQLAGIRTAAVECRPLLREVLLVGTVTHVDSASISVDVDAFEKDLPFMTPGRSVKVSSDLLPGHLPFSGEIALVEPVSAPGNRAGRVRLKIDDPNQDLRMGMLVTARLEAPIMRLPWWRRAVAEEWRNRTSVELTARCLLSPAGPVVPGGLESLFHGAVAESLSARGVGLAVPHSAIVDHGTRKVAFVESGPGMFDAVEVTVGPRCGDVYPVLRGLESGQRVAAAGAFLLDAEMWLNHGVAATYFGATRGAGTGPIQGRGLETAPQHQSPPQHQTTPSRESSPPDPSPLSAADRILATRQKVCPVTDESLDSMGGPVRLEVAGRTVFVCCQGCEVPLRKNLEKYLAKLPAK